MKPMRVKIRTKADFRVVRGNVAMLLLYLLIVLGVYGAKRIVSYSRMATEYDRLAREFPTVKHIRCDDGCSNE